MYTDDEGMVVIRGRLHQEVAALLEKALDAAMDALRKEGAIPRNRGYVETTPGGESTPWDSWPRRPWARDWLKRSAENRTRS